MGYSNDTTFSSNHQGKPLVKGNVSYLNEKDTISATFTLAVKGNEMYSRLADAAREVHKKIGKELGVKKDIFAFLFET